MANRNTRRNRLAWSKLARRRTKDAEKPTMSFARAYALARSGIDPNGE